MIHPPLTVPGLARPVRGVLFDLDDTLIDRRSAHARASELLLRERLGRVTPAALTAFDTADGDGLRPRGAFCAAVLREVPELDWTRAELWARYAPAVAAAVRPIPGRRELLQRLGQRLALGVVTNGGPLQREKLSRADLDGLWTTVRVSSEEGCAKPERRLFHLAAADLGLEPAEVLFVGDRVHEDVGGARKAGLHTCWVQGPRTSTPVPIVDWTVNSLDEVLAALCEAAGVSCGV